MDNNAECNQRVRDEALLYWIEDIADCVASGGGECWDLRTAVTAAGQNLVATGLSVADLGGTPFVAGDVGETTIYLPVILKP